MDSCRMVLVRFLLLCCPRNVSGIHPSRHHFSRFLERGQVHCISAKVGNFFPSNKKRFAVWSTLGSYRPCYAHQKCLLVLERKILGMKSVLCVPKKVNFFWFSWDVGGTCTAIDKNLPPWILADVRMVLHSRSLPQLFHPWKIWVLVEPQEIDDEGNSEFVMQENVPRLIFLKLRGLVPSNWFAKERSDPWDAAASSQFPSQGDGRSVHSPFAWTWKGWNFWALLTGGKLLDIGRLKVYLTLSLNLRLVLASPTVCWPVWLLNRRWR